MLSGLDMYEHIMGYSFSDIDKMKRDITIYSGVTSVFKAVVESRFIQLVTLELNMYTNIFGITHGDSGEYTRYHIDLFTSANLQELTNEAIHSRTNVGYDFVQTAFILATDTTTLTITDLCDNPLLKVPLIPSMTMKDMAAIDPESNSEKYLFDNYRLTCTLSAEQTATLEKGMYKYHIIRVHTVDLNTDPVLAREYVNEYSAKMSSGDPDSDYHDLGYFDDNLNQIKFPGKTTDNIKILAYGNVEVI